MISNAAARLLIALGALGALAACDHKGQRVAEGGSLAGLWLDAVNYDDFVRGKDDPRVFCDLTEAHRSAIRTFDDDGSDRPRVIEVTPNGDVVRWLPKDEYREERRHRPVVTGIDRLRLVGLNSMVRRGSDGDEPFTRVDERLATRYVRSVERCDRPRGAWRE